MPRTITIPTEVHALLELGAHLVISVSGGKDSQAMTSAVRRHLPGVDARLLFADLGSAEWPQTRGMVQDFSRRYGAPLEVVQKRGPDGRPQDFVDYRSGGAGAIKPTLSRVGYMDPRVRRPADRSCRNALRECGARLPHRAPERRMRR